jgi:hypothetical protein
MSSLSSSSSSSSGIAVTLCARDLLTATQTYIINLCSSTGMQPAKGMTREIFKTWNEVDIYKLRGGPDVKPDETGTAMISPITTADSTSQYVAHLFVRTRQQPFGVDMTLKKEQAQLISATRFEQNVESDPEADAQQQQQMYYPWADIPSILVADTSRERFKWFVDALDDLLKQIKVKHKSEIVTFAFPYRLLQDQIWDDRHWHRYDTELQSWNLRLQTEFPDDTIGCRVFVYAPTKQPRVIKKSCTQSTLLFTTTKIKK